MAAYYEERPDAYAGRVAASRQVAFISSAINADPAWLWRKLKIRRLINLTRPRFVRRRSRLAFRRRPARAFVRRLVKEGRSRQVRIDRPARLRQERVLTAGSDAEQRQAQNVS